MSRFQRLKDGVRQIRKSYQGHDDAVGDDDLAFVNQRLDELTRQLARMAQANRAPRAERDHAPDRVADALARLDHRLDQAIREGRAQAPEFDRARRVVPRQATRQPSAAPPQPRPQAQPANHGPASWAAQISARQRVLDGGPAAAAPMADWGPAVAPPPYAPAHAARPAERAAAPDYSEVERQLREINQQIVSLHQPYEAAIQALRNDLAEIGRALTEAAPRRAIEALETEVRSLSERLDRSRQAAGPAAGPAIDLSGIERQLADMRGALQHLNPGESQAATEDAIRGLYDRIDRIAGAASAPHDANMLRQIEQAVTSLSGAVANVASDSALQQLTAEVHGLAAKVERIPTAPNSDALAKLESRVTALMEGDRAAQPELEGTIHALSERIDRMQLSHGDQVALGALEDRIARLAEKLDTSEARLGSSTPSSADWPM